MILNITRFRGKDEEVVARAGEHFFREFLPAQPGWQGSVVGSTQDGTVVVAGLWESEQTLQRAGDALEREPWWDEFQGSLEGGLAAQTLSSARVALGALTPATGFVQLVEGRMRDTADALEGFERVRPLLERHRPEISAMVLALAEDGTFAQLVAFTDEDAARAGEAAPRPEELVAAAQEMRGRVEGELRFTDVREPQVHLPG